MPWVEKKRGKILRMRTKRVKREGRVEIRKGHVGYSMDFSVFCDYKKVCRF